MQVKSEVPSIIVIGLLPRFPVCSGETFQAYDYGTEGNLQKYGSTKPFEYDLTKITAPVINLSTFGLRPDLINCNFLYGARFMSFQEQLTESLQQRFP